MIREFDTSAQLKMDVYLKSDNSVIVIHSGKDVPTSPFGDNFEVVSFWEGNRLVVYPFAMVERCELYEEG